MPTTTHEVPAHVRADIRRRWRAGQHLTVIALETEQPLDAVVAIGHEAGLRRWAREGCPVTAKSQRAIGAENRAAVRALMASHLGITQREISERLRISIMAVNRHVNSIRAEWKDVQ